MENDNSKIVGTVDGFVDKLMTGIANIKNFKVEADGKVRLENNFSKAVEERISFFENEMIADEELTFYLALKCLVEREEENVAPLREELEFLGLDADRLLQHPKEYLDWLNEPLLYWMRPMEIAAALLYGGVGNDES
ncbi:hypothetical protein HCI99_06190 [Listeria booriae]|uniref:Uncharacterized protein n=1 Tax=Listeria booriae TaxID=1552123 RepID=A0A7X0XCY4_9LIST|nr:hypothetical protein [Listeria booriae]MBC1491411.1 hypothetical protein [Listeria booriae]